MKTSYITIIVIAVTAINISATAIICRPIAVTVCRPTAIAVFIADTAAVIAVKSSVNVVNCSVIAFVTLNISMTIPYARWTFRKVTPSYYFCYFEISPTFSSMLNARP